MSDRRKKEPWPAIMLAGRPEAPALAEWVLRISEYADGQGLVRRVAALGRVAEPTVRKGGPVEPERRADFVQRLLTSQVRSVSVNANPEVDMEAHIRSATHPTVFATFAGSYSTRLFDLCHSMDLACEAVATREWSWSRGAEAVADIGRLSAPRPVPRPSVATVDRVALDATLLVLARLDLALLEDHQDRNYPVRSVFLRVAPKSCGNKVGLWPYARLLDWLYATVLDHRQRSLTVRRPTIPQLDAVLGTAPASGTKSKVGHWRNGRAMRLAEFDDLAERSLGKGIARFLARKLYMGATFWHVLMKEAPAQLEWALDRYAFWWALLRSDDLVDGSRSVDAVPWLA